MDRVGASAAALCGLRSIVRGFESIGGAPGFCAGALERNRVHRREQRAPDDCLAKCGGGRALQKIDKDKLPKLEYAQSELGRPALAGILIDLADDPSDRSLCVDKAVRQVIGLKVGVLMEDAGWVKTDKQGWLTPFSNNLREAKLYTKPNPPGFISLGKILLKVAPEANRNESQ